MKIYAGSKRFFFNTSNGMKTETASNSNLYYTGYPEFFTAELDAAIEQAVHNEKAGALVLISIGNMADIMHAYGHTSTEDTIYRIISAAQKIMGRTDCVFRVQRDQIAIITKNTNSLESLYLANRIVSHIKCASDIMHIKVSASRVLFPEEGISSTDIINKAFVALKNNLLGGVQTFENIESCRKQMDLANELNDAIKNDRLEFAYQPVISSADGSVYFYEALLRLEGKDGTLNSAGAMIPIAESMGLIKAVDELTLHMLVKEIERTKDIMFSLNISNLTAGNDEWLELISNMLQNKPWVANRIIVEITETVAQTHLDKVAYFVASLQALGCMVALDDFGAGYTSFRQLKTLSVDMVKIDGVFIKDLVENKDNQLFVKTMLGFTKAFGLKTVAEFVENGETAKMLMEWGVDYLQGHYFGAPECRKVW
jgi:EAL domain-containing protein (putative c-di-GMP-specific phosphodiesterase class I)/GGDEF domain-containing protein